MDKIEEQIQELRRSAAFDLQSGNWPDADRKLRQAAEIEARLESTYNCPEL